MEISHGLNADNQPRSVLIPARGLLDTIIGLYPGVIYEDDPEFQDSIGHIFQGTVSMICNGCIGMQHYDLDLISRVHQAGIDIYVFKQAVDGFISSIETQLTYLTRLVDFWRYHKVVDLGYKIEQNYTVRVVLHLTDPSRDYVGILRAEVEQALSNNEKVPLKYLIMVGLA